MKPFCQYCFNDPVTHLQQKEMCGTCEMETEVAKKKPVIPSCDNCIKESYCPMRTGGMSCTGFQQKKETNADRIRSMTDEELAKWFVNLEVKILNIQPMLDRPALEKDWLEWLQKECE